MKILKMNNMNFTDCQNEPTGNGQVAKGFFHRGNGCRELTADSFFLCGSVALCFYFAELSVTSLLIFNSYL